MSSYLTVTKEYTSPPTNLPSNALERALDLGVSTTTVSPYHRDVMTTLMLVSLRYRNCETDQCNSFAHAIEKSLFESYSRSFNDYAFYGTRLAALLCRNGNVSRFSLILTQRLFDSELDPTTVALLSEKELFPELFDNPRISDVRFEYFATQLDNEYEQFMTLYVRTILASVASQQLQLYLKAEIVAVAATISEICVDDGERYCFNLMELVERLAQEDYFNTLSGKPFSKQTETLLRHNYAAQIEMMRFYLSLKQD